MTDRSASRNAKLDDQCAIVAALIIAMRPVYLTATSQQRALLETIIGAAIWYIPKPIQAWTGKVSIGAIKAFHPDSGIGKPRLSEEHVYPRKVAARQLLEDGTLSANSMATLFRERYGRVHLITAEENKSVQPFQRAAVFTSPEDAYVNARISLVTLSADEPRHVKRRNRNAIEDILARRTLD
jgi:hypothetical protein